MKLDQRLIDDTIGNILVALDGDEDPAAIVQEAIRVRVENHRVYGWPAGLTEEDVRPQIEAALIKATVGR
jgi:hypothetical protein